MRRAGSAALTAAVWLGLALPVLAIAASAAPPGTPGAPGAPGTSGAPGTPPVVTLQAVPVRPAAGSASGTASGSVPASAAALTASAPLPGAPAAVAGPAPADGAASSAAPPLRLLVYFNRVAVEGQPAAECDSVRPLPRAVARTPAVAGAALRALFTGPTAAERAEGWRSPFSASTADLLRSVRLVQGTAYVDLAERPELLAAASSTCGAAELLVAIERTLRQFPSVRRVVVAIEGEPRKFYDAIGLRCDASNDHCNPRPFQGPPARP